jgi:hypothetical protein
MVIWPEVIDPSKWRNGTLPFADPDGTYVLRLFSYDPLFYINSQHVRREELTSTRDLLHPNCHSTSGTHYCFATIFAHRKTFVHLINSVLLLRTEVASAVGVARQAASNEDKRIHHRGHRDHRVGKKNKPAHTVTESRMQDTNSVLPRRHFGIELAAAGAFSAAPSTTAAVVVLRN